MNDESSNRALQDEIFLPLHSGMHCEWRIQISSVNISLSCIILHSTHMQTTFIGYSMCTQDGNEVPWSLHLCLETSFIHSKVLLLTPTRHRHDTCALTLH